MLHDTGEHMRLLSSCSNVNCAIDGTPIRRTEDKFCKAPGDSDLKILKLEKRN